MKKAIVIVLGIIIVLLAAGCEPSGPEIMKEQAPALTGTEPEKATATLPPTEEVKELTEQDWEKVAAGVTENELIVLDEENRCALGNDGKKVFLFKQTDADNL